MLQLYKNKIILDKEKIPEIESIHEIVDTFKEDDAIQVLMYIYLVYNRTDENPLKDFPSKERLKRAKEIAFGDIKNSIETLFPTKIKLIGQACKDYVLTTVDELQHNIDLNDNKMFEFIDLLSNPDNTPKIIRNEHEISGRVTFSTNIDIITSVLDNSIEIILEKAALTNLKHTGKFSHELRGGLSKKKKINKLIQKLIPNGNTY